MTEEAKKQVMAMFSKMTESQILMAQNDYVMAQDTHEPLVAFTPDWRVMKDEETKAPLVNPLTGGVQYGYIEVIVKSFIKLFKDSGIRLIILTPEHKVQDWVDKIDGIMIPGGRDIDPEHYGEENKGSRFDKEDALIRYNTCKNWVMEGDLKMPIFGICFGYQILNVLYGGKMDQHLENSQEHTFKCRDFIPVEGTHLHKATNGTIPHNACFHHQNVIEIPSCLKVSARDSLDGSVHALEWHDDSRTIMTVLWHPEVGEPFAQGADLEMSVKIVSYFGKLCIEYRNSKQGFVQ